MQCFFYLFILVWWSRRNDNSQRHCEVEFENENPSIEGKICGKVFLLYTNFCCQLNLFLQFD